MVRVQARPPGPGGQCRSQPPVFLSMRDPQLQAKSWMAGIGGQDTAQRVEGSVEEQLLNALMVMKVLDMPQVLGSRADVRVQVRGTMCGNLQTVPGGQGGAAQEP